MSKRKRSSELSMTVEEEILQDEAEVAAHEAEVEISEDNHWRAIDFKQDNFVLETEIQQNEYATLNVTKNITLLEIFLHFMPINFVTAVWDSYPKNHWYYKTGGSLCLINRGECPHRWLLYTIAIYIYLTGEQNGPTENKKEDRPLRTNVQDAIEWIRSTNPTAGLPGEHMLTMLISRFHIPEERYIELGVQFQSIIEDLGRFVAADEKLFHFTGDDCRIRQVPSKPDRIGFWFFELVCNISKNYSLMLLTRVANHCAELGETLSSADVVKEWGKVVIKFSEKRSDKASATLVFDSYYTTNESRAWCNENMVRYIGAVNKQRFQKLIKTLQVKTQPLEKPGQSCGIYSAQNNEVLVHHWDPDAKVGKKYVLSNAFVLRSRTGRKKLIPPAYPYYKKRFNSCDWFNRRFKDRKFGHRSGGGATVGSSGHVHKFFMACILQNTFNVYDFNHSEEHVQLDFSTKCKILAQALVEYARTVQL